MISNIIYVLATSSLLTGSILSFDMEQLDDYFYLIGTSLFFIKSGLNLITEIRDRNRDGLPGYYSLGDRL
jgi:hypothetical protein